MAKSRNRKNKKKTRRTRKAPRGAPTTAGQRGSESALADTTHPDENDEVLVALWPNTRSGARAGRGFHFQDAVGAWLAAGLAAGSIAETKLTPEGLEDMTLEGAHHLHLQAKSRVGYLGPFPLGQACRHILDAWERHEARGNSDQRLAVVLESGVRDVPGLRDVNEPLARSLPDDSPMRGALSEAAAKRGLSDQGLARLMSTTAVMGVDWKELTARTTEHLESVVDLPSSALLLIARELRTKVAEAADANVNPAYEARQSLSRTDLVSTIEHVAGHIDLSAIESAVVDGVCEPFETGVPPSVDDSYYEGVATQPWHVAAGLVVPRPQIMAEVVLGLQERSAVVLTGPSGVGKSAILWMVPAALPGVLWYRIHRVSESDVPALIRLARAYSVSADTPVGFLVDAAGRGDFRGWARLRTDAAAVPGLLLAGAARIEDVAELGDLSNCTTVSVSLDEDAAEVIFDGLVTRGVTSAPHWREAFDRSNRLTLEYTHMLTQGRRLGEVIADQIRVRTDEDRYQELELLSLISVADRWSATIRLDDVAIEMGVGSVELRKAVGRLADEHMLVENLGLLSGLHQLRSVAISDALHNSPPPDLASTVGRTLNLVPTAQLHRFIANLLRDEEELVDSVIEAARSGSLSLRRAAGYLHGLRLSDFYGRAREWKTVADRLEVPPSSQMVLFSFAAAGIEFPEVFPEELRVAKQEIDQVVGGSNRDRLVGELRITNLARLAVDAETASEAALLLSTLDGVGNDLTAAIAVDLDGDSALVAALSTAPLTEVGECLEAAGACDPALAELLVASIGGQARILERIRSENPWVTELGVRQEDEATIGYARLLHVSDDLQGDPREQAIALGRHLLRCLPEIDSVDVQALLPGGHEIRLGDHTHGTSGLLRRYDRASLSVAWNQASLRAAFTLVADADTTRLAQALPLIREACDVTGEIGTSLVTGDSGHTDVAALDRRRAELHRRAKLLRPSLGAIRLADTDIGQEASVPLSDSIYGLLTDLTGNVFARISNRDGYRALAAYLADTVRQRYLADAYSEPWYVLGFGDHPDGLDDLSAVLADLSVVIEALASGSIDDAQLVPSARAGSRTRALRRAADTCRKAIRRTRASRRHKIDDACSATGLATRVLEFQDADDVVITVSLSSLVEWGDAVATLQEALEGDRLPGENFTLIPMRDSRPVPSMTMRHITRLWPAPGLGGRDSELTPAHPSELADTFDEASTALQTLSGISQLEPDQQSHSNVQAAVSVAAEVYRSVRQNLDGFADDELTRELRNILDALAAHVDEELGGTASGASVAESVVVGALQEEDSEVFNVLVGARVMALEWDIDRPGALELFESFNGA